MRTVNQEQIRESLIEEMSGMDIIDSHEHLPAESERLGQQVDFATLFSHYCKSDLVSAGRYMSSRLRAHSSPT